MLTACTDEYLSANVTEFIPAPNQVRGEIAPLNCQSCNKKAAAGRMCHARGLPAGSEGHSTKFWDIEMGQSLCLNR